MPCKHWFEGMVARSETACPFCEIERLRAVSDSTALDEYLKANGWRQCAQGQRTTQYCGLTEEAVRQAEERVEAIHAVELDLLREIGEMLEPVEYRGSYAEGIKAAIRQAKREALLDAAGHGGALWPHELRRMADELKD